MVIYRYPFHLRPKDKRTYQYLRMAIDLLHDLDLDKCCDDCSEEEAMTTSGQLDGIRAYLGCFYIVATYGFNIFP